MGEELGRCTNASCGSLQKHTRCSGSGMPQNRGANAVRSRSYAHLKTSHLVLTATRSGNTRANSAGQASSFRDNTVHDCSVVLNMSFPSQTVWAVPNNAT